MVYSIVLAALTCYLLGNHNGAICISAMLHDDVREHGSGNAGLTNFIRNFGGGRAAMVIAIDIGKTVLACLLAERLLTPYGCGLEGKVLGGLFVMLGHDFPILQGFRGGKGILSGLAVAFAVDWRVGVIVVAAFFAAYLATKYVSLGSVLSSVAFGAGFVIFYHQNTLVMLGGIAMSALAVFMHRGNIVRLLKGEERKTNLFGKGKQQ